MNHTNIVLYNFKGQSLELVIGRDETTERPFEEGWKKLFVFQSNLPDKECVERLVSEVPYYFQVLYPACKVGSAILYVGSGGWSYQFTPNPGTQNQLYQKIASFAEPVYTNMHLR